MVAVFGGDLILVRWRGFHFLATFALIVGEVTAVDLDHTIHLLRAYHQYLRLTDLVQQRERGSIVPTDDAAQCQCGQSLLIDDEREDGHRQLAVTDLWSANGLLVVTEKVCEQCLQRHCLRVRMS